MENEENNSEGRIFAKEVGKAFLISFAYGAGTVLGMAVGVYAISKLPKTNPATQITTTE